MATILNYSPGMKVTLYLETVDASGILMDADYLTHTIDGYHSPTIHRLIKTDFDGYYPQPMTRLDTGIYYYQFTLPTGSVSIGSFFADIDFLDPATDTMRHTAFQILVSAPMGLYSISTR
jgi:hypothetical protein